MSKKYLLHFVHEHIAFRWIEFTSLACKHNCEFKLLSDKEHVGTRPYIIVELEKDSHEEDLVQCAQDSYLLKGLYELWGHSHESIDHLAKTAMTSSEFLSRKYSTPDQTFRVNCLSFGSKLTQELKVDWIQRMKFIDTFQSKPNLRDPKQIYCIFEMNEIPETKSSNRKEYFFGRQLVEGNRSAVQRYSLKQRSFIANTSMDPLLGLIIANCAKIKNNDLVYDPFVGSGGLLIAAAHKGAKTLGADIDWLLLHGKSRPSRKGQAERRENEGVRLNFEQYDLEDFYLDVVVSDITRSPVRPDFRFDSILSDPPYGIRECSEKIGSKKERKVITSGKVRYPAKMNYRLQDLYGDLLNLAARHLKLQGRLVFYLPIAKESRYKPEDFIPQHQCLEMISFCEQTLTSKASRLLVVMEKTREPTELDRSYVPCIVDGVNFRDSYFNKTALHLSREFWIHRIRKDLMMSSRVQSGIKNPFITPLEELLRSYPDLEIFHNGQKVSKTYPNANSSSINKKDKIKTRPRVAKPEFPDTKGYIDDTIAYSVSEICQRLGLSQLPDDPLTLCKGFTISIEKLDTNPRQTAEFSQLVTS